MSSRFELPYTPLFLAVAALFGLFLAGCGGCDLEKHVREYAGSGAVDCGVSSPSSHGVGYSCSVDAYNRHLPFIAVFQEFGSDVEVKFALATNRAGELALFRFMGEREGGKEEAVVTRQRCEPAIREEPEGAKRMDCTAIGPVETICGGT